MIAKYFSDSIMQNWQHSLLNEVRLFCPTVVGMSTAYIVSRAAHSIFGYKKGEKLGLGLQLASIAAGSAAGIYAGSYFPLHPLTFTAAWEVIRVAIPSAIIVRIITKQFFGVTPPITGVFGALSGLNGTFVVAITTTALAASVVRWSNE